MLKLQQNVHEGAGVGQGDEQGLGLLRDHRSRFYSRMKGILGELKLGSNSVWFISSGNLPVAVVGEGTRRTIVSEKPKMSWGSLLEPLMACRSGGNDHEKLVQGLRGMFWRLKEKRSLGGS